MKRCCSIDIRNTITSSVATPISALVIELSPALSACDTISGIISSVTSSIGESWPNSRLPSTRKPTKTNR